MASWQAHVLNGVLRLTMKRHGRKGVDIERARRTTVRPPKRALHVPEGWAVREVALEGLHFDVAERDGRGAETPRRLVLFLHGGGYFFGSPKTHRQVVLGLARSLDARAYALDYRLAPEHPFPAAYEDAIAAYRRLAARYPGVPIVIAGDSAGGGLAIATAVALRQQRLSRPLALITFSPWTDLAATGASLARNDRSCAMFTEKSIRQACGIYLGSAAADDPRASPLYADLRDLPPLQVFASRHEVLHDDSVRLAERARHHGVTVELIERDRMPHVWPIFHRMLPEGREALEDVARFVTAATPQARDWA